MSATVNAPSSVGPVPHGDGDVVGGLAGGAGASDLEHPFGPNPFSEVTVRERLALERVAERQEEQREALVRAAAPVPFVPFPTSRLPVPVAGNIVASAAAIGCDEALVALPSLSVLGGAVGNSHRVLVKTSWWEPSMVWTATVSPSGTSKSPALDAALGPVYALEREAKEEHADRMELFEEEMRKYAALDKRAKANASPPSPPVQVRFRLGDSTIEGVSVAHAPNPRGLLMARDEGGGWLGARDRYANGDADSYNWNELGGGRQMVIDRKGNLNGPIIIERPAVAVAVGLQPGILSSKLSAADFVSGFAARILFAQPPPRPRVWTEAGVSPDVIREYHDLIRTLYARPDGGEEVPLSPEAKELFKRWVNDNGRKTALLSEADPLRSAFSKVEAYAARFALIFHLSHVAPGLAPEAAPPPVTGEAMQDAVEVACWFRYELARIYDLHGFRRGGAHVPNDRDEALAGQLPTPFSADDVGTLWGVQQSRAYSIIKKLERNGLAEKRGPGVYAPLLTPPEKVERPEKLDFQSLLTVEDAP